MGRKNKNTYDLSKEYGIGYTANGDEFYFDCDVYRIHFMPVYDACVSEVQDIFKDRYVRVDPAPWGADTVYRIKYEDGWSDRLIICKDNVIAEISMTSTPDETQMSTISEKLFIK